MSSAVAVALGWRRAGFGDFLREEIVRTGGDPQSREALQNLGQRLVKTDPEAFCRSVLAAGGFTRGENFVVDGIRHVEIFRILGHIAAPSTARLLFLNVDETHRLGRVADRPDKDDFARAVTHRVEAELREDLPELADLVVDATQPFDDVIANCLAHIRLWQQA
ncbi:MAG: hypothetical protein ACYCOU_17050 [Sulfobacillus sp.]